MSWYRDWFNSENYLKIYSHRDESEAQRLVELITKNINLKSNSKILDMACGSGRHAIIFAKKRFDVTAVDLSERLLSEAKENSDQNSVKIDFVLTDILDFETTRRFNLALNLFTSFGYFDDDEDNFRVILKAYDLLTDGGYFVIDYFNKNYLLKNLIPTSVFSENGLRITQNRLIEANRVRKNIFIESNGSTQEFYESVRLYSYEEMITYIKKAGFNIFNEFGGYNGNYFNKESSPRLIIIAKK
ncbi:MAG: methyltransferase domain-containing protein [Ignavibacteriaceae bacterium]|jgi:SAM-dependent methyltransferase|nr:methyltransferase domain-containing protein [Ignavibacteriaceae bacterium]